MGDNPRRVYIYPPRQQDDGADASRFWPPAVTGAYQFNDRFQPTPSDDQIGGLLGKLLQAMRQGQDQPDADSSLTSSGGPDGADRDANFRQLSRAPFVNRQQDGIALRGPIGGGRLNATTSAIAGGMFARPPANTLRVNSLPAGAQAAGINVGLPTTANPEDSFPAATAWLRQSDPTQAVSHPSASQIGASATMLRNPMSLPMLAGGELNGIHGGPLPPWISVSPSIQASQLGLPERPVEDPGLPDGTTVLNQDKRPDRGKRPKNNSADDSDDDDDDNRMPSPEEFKARLNRQIRARAAERASTFSGGYDPKRYCAERQEKEEERCRKRWPEYSHPRDYKACRDNTWARFKWCRANNESPHPDEPPLWDLGHEEVGSPEFVKWLQSLRPKPD